METVEGDMKIQEGDREMDEVRKEKDGWHLHLGLHLVSVYQGLVHPLYLSCIC